LFPNASPSIFTALNIAPMATDNSPFGPVVTIPASPNNIADIARLPGVQAIAPAYPRKLANDLARPRLGVSADSLITTSNYLGLSGQNVLVNINDSGVDATHPDLMGRITADFTNNLTDTDGHGTHVAGTILGNGSQSATVTNASGSVIPGASFRGMATNATAYVLNVDYSSDSYLQEQAALTNALISNNSWNYGDAAYDIDAASYDAAVRDALPEVSGPQPLIFVFSAGNSGGGTPDGQNGSGRGKRCHQPAV
jgi:subtilisin family serine protease